MNKVSHHNPYHFFVKSSRATMEGVKMATIILVIIMALLPGWAMSTTSTPGPLQAGQDCSGANSALCATGLTCENGVCKLGFLGDCSGPNSAYCGTGLTCEYNRCMLGVGGNCSAPNTYNCGTGLRCENDVCMLGFGGDCSAPNAANCVTGLTCVYDVCKLIAAGGDCSGPNSAYCDRPWLTCEHDVCKLVVRALCSGPNAAYCATGLTCENGACKLNVGGDCSSPYSSYCAFGLTCDRHVCKLDVGGDCSGPNSGNCATGLTCDTSVCRFGVGHECNSTEECTYNSYCGFDDYHSGYCACDRHFYSLGSRCVAIDYTSIAEEPTTAYHQHVSHITAPPATTPWLTTVPYWMSLTTATSRDFHWAYTPQDYERLVVCAGQEITIPWRYTLGEGEQVEDVTWFRVPEGGVSEDIALFGRGHFLEMPAYTGRVHWTGEGGIVLSGATVGDSGRYTVVVTVVSPSKNSFSKYQRTVLVQVAEPPQTYDGQLHVSQSGQAVKDNVTGEWSIQLTCGHFYTRGHPHVDVEWTTPDGYSILSSNYSGGEFTLLLPSPPTGGNYSCELLTHQPAPSCLPYYSHLLEVATVEVNEVKAGFSILSAEQGEVRRQLQELKEENRLLRQDVQSCGCSTGRP